MVTLVFLSKSEGISINSIRNQRNNKIYRHKLESSGEHVYLIKRNNYSSSNLSFGHTSKSELSSTSLISLTRAISYDLLNHSDMPKLEKMVRDYIANNRWKDSCQLKDVRLHPFHDKIKATALASYPRSGNTWMRLLLEKSTGYATSSVYCDETKLFRFECDKSNLFLIKTHDFESNTRIWRNRPHFDQFICLVRNPFDTILSYYEYIHSNESHTVKTKSSEGFHGNNSTEAVSSLLSNNTVREMISNYREFFNYWRRVNLPRMFVRYEDLRESTSIILRYVRRFVLPMLMDNNGSNKEEIHPSFLYYIDNISMFSSTNEKVIQYIKEEHERIACAVGDDILNEDIIYKSNKFNSLYSLKYYMNSTINFMIQELLEPLCYFKYDILFKNQLGIPCKQ